MKIMKNLALILSYLYNVSMEYGQDTIHQSIIQDVKIFHLDPVITIFHQNMSPIFHLFLFMKVLLLLHDMDVIV